MCLSFQVGPCASRELIEAPFLITALLQTCRVYFRFLLLLQSGVLPSEADQRLCIKSEHSDPLSQTSSAYEEIQHDALQPGLCLSFLTRDHTRTLLQ